MISIGTTMKLETAATSTTTKITTIATTAIASKSVKKTYIDHIVQKPI